MTNASLAMLVNNSTHVVEQLGVSHVVVIIMLFFVMIVVCGSNALVILSVCLSPELHTITNMFVVNLACADILVTAQPILLIVYLIRPELLQDQVMCMARLFFAGLPLQASAGTLTGE